MFTSVHLVLISKYGGVQWLRICDNQLAYCSVNTENVPGLCTLNCLMELVVSCEQCEILQVAYLRQPSLSNVQTGLKLERSCLYGCGTLV